VLLIGDVELAEFANAACGADGLGQRLALVRYHVADDDTGAVFREQPRFGRPLPSAAAGDENGLVMKFVLRGLSARVAMGCRCACRPDGASASELRAGYAWRSAVAIMARQETTPATRIQ